MLRGRKPHQVQKRLKLLMYGDSGVGKTTCALGFPKPYVIDMERGAEMGNYSRLIESNGGVLFQTDELSEVQAEILALISEPHEFRTLVIDPITVGWDESLDRNEKVKGDAYGKHRAAATSEWAKIKRLITRLDMTCVVTAHGKKVFDSDGQITYQGPTGLDYFFDLVVEARFRGKQRVGVIAKSRYDEFELGETLPLGYESIRQRLGEEAVDREAQTEELATEEQVQRARALVGQAQVDPDLVDKWMKKANANDWHEMPAAKIDKCIEWMQARATA